MALPLCPNERVFKMRLVMSGAGRAYLHELLWPLPDIRLAEN